MPAKGFFTIEQLVRTCLYNDNRFRVIGPDGNPAEINTLLRHVTSAALVNNNWMLALNTTQRVLTQQKPWLQELSQQPPLDQQALDIYITKTNRLYGRNHQIIPMAYPPLGISKHHTNNGAFPFPQL